MMKNNFIIFYSWMSDRPSDQNMSYIRNCLTNDCSKLEKKLGVKISLDSDSRKEKGDETIDAVILKKITHCDFFVCDITPIRKPLFASGRSQEKEIPNPNVLYELGFAVSALGWSRCILVWNEKYGDLSKAPFDIRNHSTIAYRIGKKDLSFYEILNKKIKQYDELVKEWRSGKERSFDCEIYNRINQICSERNLVDSIDSFLTNQVYNALEFSWWDNLYYNYHHYPDNRFVDDEIHQAYLSFLSELHRMILFVIRHNAQIRHSDRPDEEVGTDEWRREEIYKIRDPYDYMDEMKASALQAKIDEEYNSLIPSLMDSYRAFRDLIRKKLLV